MSSVTDIILTTSINEKGVKEIKSHIESAYKNNLNRADEGAGGNKFMQCDVFLTAINYMLIDELLDCFNAATWEYPESVQLLIKDEHDDAFTIYTPKPFNEE